MSVACATEYSFCYKNFFGFNVLAVPKSQTLIINDKTLVVALNQLLLITVQMLNESVCPHLEFQDIFSST